MTGVDPATLTEASTALLTQQALLAGIQYSFYVTFAINIVVLILALFVKRVDTSAEVVQKLEQQGSTQMKVAAHSN
jgi:hypothetical protein